MEVSCFFVKPENKSYLVKQLNNLQGNVVNFKFINKGVENWNSTLWKKKNNNFRLNRVIKIKS